MPISTQYAVHAKWLLAVDDGKPTILYNRYVITEGNEITAITDTKPSSAELVAESGELLVMPGFINLHNHCSSSVMFRGLSEYMPSDNPTDFPVDLVYGLLMPFNTAALEVLNSDETRAMFDLGLLEIIKGGTTTLMEQFRIGQQGTCESATDMGLRFYCMPYLMSHAPVGVTSEGQPQYRSIKDVDDLIGDWENLFNTFNCSANDRLRIGLGPHGTDTCDADLIRRIRGLADTYDCLITIHLSQTESEEDMIQGRYDMTPSEYLDYCGLLGPDLLAAHCIFASNQDLELLKTRNVTVANCPLTFGRGGVFAPYHKFSEFGLRTVIGTDGYRMDIVGEMRAAALVSKLHAGRANATPSYELISAVTIAAADYLGRPDLGRIMPGARADLIGIDLAKPYFQPVSDPIKTFLWNADRSDVSLVMVDGKVLVKEAISQFCDEDKIIRKGVDAVKRVWKEVHSKGIVNDHFFENWYYDSERH